MYVLFHHYGVKKWFFWKLQQIGIILRHLIEYQSSEPYTNTKTFQRCCSLYSLEKNNVSLNWIKNLYGKNQIEIVEYYTIWYNAYDNVTELRVRAIYIIYNYYISFQLYGILRLTSFDYYTNNYGFHYQLFTIIFSF